MKLSERLARWLQLDKVPPTRREALLWGLLGSIALSCGPDVLHDVDALLDAAVGLAPHLAVWIS